MRMQWYCPRCGMSLHLGKSNFECGLGHEWKITIQQLPDDNMNNIYFEQLRGLDRLDYARRLRQEGLNNAADAIAQADAEDARNDVPPAGVRE